MKAVTLRPTEAFNPEYSEEDRRRAMLQRLPYRVKKIVQHPAGRVIDHPEAWKLVEFGIAVPVDEECRAAADMSEEALVIAIAKQELLSQGRATGDPKVDLPEKPSNVTLPEEWQHLAEPVREKIAEYQRRINSLHSDAKEAEQEEKAAERTMFVIDATDLPPEQDDLPEE